MAEGLYLKIKGSRISYFNDVAFTLKYDSVGSGFSFSFIEVDNKSINDLVSLPSDSKVEVFYNNTLLITGLLINIRILTSPIANKKVLRGYSKGGIIEDSNTPLKIYPLQSNNLNLSQIASKFLDPFDIKFSIDSSVISKMNKKISSTKASPTETVKDYLTSLTSQRNIVISHDPKGDLIFTLPNTDKLPILDLDFTNGLLPGTNFDFDVDLTGMHSSITVFKQKTVVKSNSGESTIDNPYITYEKPKVIVQTSGDENDTDFSARMALGNELSNIKLTINIDRWVIDDKIILPNNMIKFYAPGHNLKGKTLFYIESVDYIGDGSANSATLNCVLPDVYNNKPVKSIFK